MAIQHIIFDLDGTLMDTEKGNLYAWQKTLRYYVPWRTFSNTELKAILGVTTEKALTMLQVENVDAAQFDEYWQLQYQTQVEHIYIGDMDTDMECAARAGVSSALAVWGTDGPVSQGCLSSPQQISAFVQNV